MRIGRARASSHRSKANADGTEHRADCRFIAGCDGFHCPSHKAVRMSVGKALGRVYTFGWLGSLADLPLTGKIEDWSDDRTWDELAICLCPEVAAHMTRGPSIEKSIAPLRSYVVAPIRHGSLLLCGDSAHIVPPTGAEGLNLAAGDVHYAAEAMTGFFKRNDGDFITACSDKSLTRVWTSEPFSWSLTRLMHRLPEDVRSERHAGGSAGPYRHEPRGADIHRGKPCWSAGLISAPAPFSVRCQSSSGQ
jgi:p-hydroxybenzoate 3-monooxygenase